MRRSALRIDLKRDASGAGFSDAWVKRTVARTLRSERAPRRRVGVYLTGDRRIRAINRKFLAHDHATDVLSFGAGTKLLAGEEADHLGDLVVSVDRARTMSRKLGISFKEELARYLVHGTLHLLGYEDESPKKAARMKRRQESIVKNIMDGKR